MLDNEQKEILENLNVELAYINKYGQKAKEITEKEIEELEKSEKKTLESD